MSIFTVIDFVTSSLASHLWDPVITNMKYLTKMEENIEKLDSTVKSLEARKHEIQIRLRNSERKQEICNPEVIEWIEKVAAMKNEVKEMKNGQKKRRQPFNYWSKFETGTRAAKKLKEAEMLHEKGAFKHVSIEIPPYHVQEVPTVPVTKETYYNLIKILHCLKDEKVGTVGIWGMGGVGKTTLLRKINNHFLGVTRENYGFDHIIYVAASMASGIGQLQAEIAEKTGLFLKPGSSMEVRASVLLNFLRTKKFLLLIDDLWGYLDLADAGIPYPIGLNKQKLIVATRHENVCGHMGAQKTIRVECLDQENAWQLFKEKATEDVINSDARIGKLAKEVAEECGGLPLALATLGRAMSTKKTYHEWALALSYLKKSRIHEIPNMGNIGHIYTKLKLSYDYLQDKQIKECFLCCSLWPEGYSIWKVELIDCWIGMGLIEHDTIEEAYDKGYSFIEYLKNACLLESGYLEDIEVRLHDVIRDMALRISSDCSEDGTKWSVRAGAGIHSIANRDIENWRSTSTSKISLMCNYINELPQAISCPSLQYLSLQQNFQMKVIPASFFQSILYVSYLDLSWVPIKELPEEIGALVELQHLKLKQTHVKLLPQSIGQLKKLKYLHLNYMDFLQKIPYGVLSNLSMLQVLNLYGSWYAGCEVDFDSTNHMEYNEFRVEELACLTGELKSLGITIKKVSTLKRLFGIRGVNVRFLGLYILNGETSLTLTVPESVIVLNVTGCSDLKEFSAINNRHCYGYYLPKLEFLTFWDLPRLENISIEQFQNLRVLTVGKTYQLKDLSCILKLPYLEHLDVSFCNKMKKLVDTENGSSMEAPVQGFRQLKILQLGSLPSLDCFSSSRLDFPSLEYIDVFCCPKLKKLPFGNDMGRLKRIRGERTWWDDLEWDDGGSLLSLFPFFEASQSFSASFRPELDSKMIASPEAFFTKRQPLLHSSVRFTSYLKTIFEDEGYVKS